MITKPPALSWKEVVFFHVSYLIPILLRGALISRRFGTWLLRFHPDPIGRRFFSRLLDDRGERVYQCVVSNPPFGFDRTCILLDTELISQVLVADAASYEVADINRESIEHFAPHSLIVSDGCKHAELRGYSAAPQRLATNIDASLHPQAKRLLEAVEAELAYTLESSRAHFQWLDFSSLAARLSVRILLGPDVDRDNTGLSEMRLVQMHKRLVYSATRFFGRRSRYFKQYYCLLRRRMSDRSGYSLIGMSDEEHASQAQVTYWLMALNGGLDTALPRTLALIISHEGVYGKVLAELSEIDLKNQFEIDKKLPLLEGCILEAIRLWTDTPLINRKRTSDGKIGEYTILAGTQVLIPAAYLHRDPTVFGETANMFKPERWLDGRCQDGLQFGLGTRSCAGRNIALFVMKATLALFLVHRSLRLVQPKLMSTEEIPDVFSPFRLLIEKV